MKEAGGRGGRERGGEKIQFGRKGRESTYLSFLTPLPPIHKYDERTFPLNARLKNNLQKHSLFSSNLSHLTCYGCRYIKFTPKTNDKPPTSPFHTQIYSRIIRTKKKKFSSHFLFLCPIFIDKSKFKSNYNLYIQKKKKLKTTLHEYHV